jgi:hypothetical protein
MTKKIAKDESTKKMTQQELNDFVLEFLNDIETYTNQYTDDIFLADDLPEDGSRQLLMEDLEEAITISEHAFHKVIDMVDENIFTILIRYIVSNVKHQLKYRSIPDDCRFHIYKNSADDTIKNAYKNAHVGWLKYALDNNLPLKYDEDGKIDISKMRPRGNWRKAIPVNPQNDPEQYALVDRDSFSLSEAASSLVIHQ